jgi:CheY-like chemotaxis protein
VENDATFARLLIDVARENGFKAILAMRGAAALAMARDRRPDAITLDLNLPEIDGWRVLEKLKRDLSTRHIPVQVITTADEDARALKLGAHDVLHKPLKTREALEETIGQLSSYVRNPERRVLVIDSEEQRAASTQAMLGGADVQVDRAPSAAAVGDVARSARPDVIVLANLDSEGAEMLERMERGDLPFTPVVVFADDLDLSPAAAVERAVKYGHLRHVRSPERLFDEVSLLLHRRTATMSEEQRGMIDRLYRSNEPLKGKKVLIVDDDIRNIFALTTLLEGYELSCIAAETGQDAVRMLSSTPDVDLVLMDIMMPVMDGYETMREIRRLPHFRALPIFAITAKAMKGDREKCFEAGATDYLAKPVESEQLLSMMRLWLHR